MQGRFGTSLDPRLGTDRSCSAHKGHPCCGVVTAQGAQMKGNTAKTGLLLMDSKEGAAQDVFAAHLRARLESAEACWSCRQAFVP